MECIDRKFRISARSIKSGKRYSQANSILFLTTDILLPDLLDKYYELASQKGADNRQLIGITLLKERVIAWQRVNVNKVHLPDVEEGKEEKRVCKPNNL